MSAKEPFRFGDIAEGIHASDDNPHKQGFVVRTGHRQGRMNAGRYVVLTNSKVEFKTNPSRHECDARCINATGRVMKCECSCGGKNHGRGAFACAEVA